MIRQVTSKLLRSNVRFSSEKSSRILTEIHPDEDEIAIVKMNAPPINAMSSKFLKDLQNTIINLENNEDIRALILTSANQGVFSAGLDITEMWRKDETHLRKFWTQLQDTWRALYSSKLATIAAINGTSPAGGCLLSISCDYRIMANNPKFQIGLNETKLGLVAPAWFVRPFEDCIGRRNSEKLLYLGALIKSNEALKIGLIDQEENIENVLPEATKMALNFLSVPDFARENTKIHITRKENLEKFDKTRENDVDLFVQMVSSEMVQNTLDFYMEMLKAKSSKKENA